MKKRYLQNVLLAIICVMAFTSIQAQIDCGNLDTLVNDNFDSYTTGALGPQADHWTTWSGTEGEAEDGIVTADLANSGENSFRIEGTAGGGPQDVVLLLGNKTEGVYLLEWQMYVLTDFGAYYNIQHDEVPGGEWANEIEFSPDGTATLDAGVEGAKTFDYPHDEWFRIRYVIDLDNDVTYLWVGSEYVYSWPFSWQQDEMTGLKVLGGIDFYPRDADDFYYVDDLFYAQLPAVEDQQYCHTATTIDVGTHAIDTITCYGAGFTVRDGGQGQGGAWFSYTPAESGRISVSSCGAGADSRVWIFSGGCENLDIEGVNDDRCGINVDGEQEWASYRESFVTAGETYFIVWDNVWDNVAFDFELSFTSEDAASSDFCETATAVEPGTYLIEEINGSGAVSGPNINHTGSSTTAYAQSEWYSFTPAEDGMMTVSTCDLTLEDTRLWIYTGDCGIENLVLVANNDDDCGLQSLVADMDVTAGVTYLIEWDSEDLNATGFDWELAFSPLVDITELQFNSTFVVSPNPSSDVAFVNYQLPEATDIKMYLYNSLGQMVNSMEIANAQAGQQKIDVSQLSAGVYFLVLTDGVNTVNRKLVVE